jgi:streptogramin lyase
MKSAKTGTVMAAAMILGLGTGAAMAGDGPELQQFAIDSNGNIVIPSADTHQVLRVEQGGRVTVLAGTGEAGNAGDGGYATDALLQRPSGVAIDADGSILFGDAASGRVRKIDSLSGVISNVDSAGTSTLDEPFVKIKSPNTPQAWFEGSVKAIRWTHNLGKSARFTLDVSRDGGQHWDTIAQNIQGKEYGWRVAGQATPKARFRVTQELEQKTKRNRERPMPQSDINDANVELLAAR